MKTFLEAVDRLLRNSQSRWSADGFLEGIVLNEDLNRHLSVSMGGLGGLPMSTECASASGYCIDAIKPITVRAWMTICGDAVRVAVLPVATTIWIGPDLNGRRHSHAGY